MNPSELFIGRFPLGGTTGVKLRPVLRLSGPLGTAPEYVAAYISSVIPDVLLPTDILPDPADVSGVGTNLNQVSVLRLHKIATLHRRDFVRRLGAVSPTVFTAVQSALRITLNL
jgi:mRNA interferase MazF